MTIPKGSLLRSSSTIFLALSVSLLLLFPSKASGLESRKLDEEPLGEIKCGGCPCGTTCYLSPPPPPPSPPPPPKKPTPAGCPPPPYSPGFIYITGPPGNLYPIDQSFSGAFRNFAASNLWPALLGYGLLALLMFWT